MTLLQLAFAFAAGLVSFVAPCVLPLIPGYLAYLAGTTLSSATPQKKKEIFYNSLFFVLGFSIVFALLGVLLNSVLTRVAYDVQLWLSRLGGLIIIFFGLYLMGLIHIPWLEREHKFRPNLSASGGKLKYLTSMVFGAAFAVGWTPCVGAVLGGILALAATNPGASFSLLLAYALGLGLPFILVGLFTGSASAFIAKYSAKLKYVNIVFGVLMIALGILIFTESLTLIANFSLVNSLILKL